MSLNTWRSLFLHNPLLAAALFLQKPIFRGNLTKVGFPIADETGRQIGREWMWCRRVGFDLFTLDNIPAHAPYVELGDLVSAGWSRDGWLFIELRFRGLANPSGAGRSDVY